MIVAFLLPTIHLLPKCCVSMGLILFAEIIKQGNICIWNECEVETQRFNTSVLRIRDHLIF